MMKEEMQVNTYTDSPCKKFIPHRFKTSHCVHCFKPESLHAQDDPIIRENQKENVPELIEINSNHIVTPGKENILNKNSARTSNKNGSFGKPKQLEDGVLDRSMLAGKTRQLRKQFESQDAKKPQQTTVNMNHKHKNGAMYSTNEQSEHDFVMNIPIKANIDSEIKDLNSNSNHNGAINDHYESDSDSDTLSEAVGTRFWSPKIWSPTKATRAMDPIPSAISDEGIDGNADAENEDDVPVLKSVHPLDKEDATPSDGKKIKHTRNQSVHSLQEFQKVAQLLRHVDPPPDSPKAERKPIKRPSPRPATRTNVQSAAQVSVSANVDLNKQEKSNHDRKPDPEPTDCVKHQATPVTKRVEEVSSDAKEESRKSRTELPETSAAKPNQMHAKSYKPVNISQLDLSVKPVTIKYKDGSVSRYDGAPRPIKKAGVDNTNVTESQAPSVKPEDQPQQRLQSPSKTKPYFVVDISREFPKGLSTKDRRSITSPPLPCTPPPRTRPVSQHSSHDSGDEIARSNSIDSALTDSTGSDISVVRHTSGIANTPDNNLHMDDSKRNTPPFPMLLGTEGYEPPAPPTKNRRERKDRNSSSGSSQYKVPIFIGSQNYDNLGTAKSDSETKLDQLVEKTPEDETAPRPPVRSDSNDYLVPMRDSLESNVSGNFDVLSPVSRDSGNYSAISENETKNSNQVTNNQDDFRNRAQSHPQQKPEPVYAKITHDVKKGAAKQKRTAPAPPLNELDESDCGFSDTLPRSPPPPPPPPPQANKEKRGSSSSANFVDVPRKQQATNIYSQAPQRRPVPERPKMNPPQASPEKALGSNKGQAPRLKAEQKPDPSSKLNLDKSVSPPKKFSQSVRVKTQELPNSPVARSSASARSKEPSSSKAKAPIPLQIHNAISPRSGSQSPPQSKAPIPKEKQVTGVSQAQSPPVRRSNGPLEAEVPLPPKRQEEQTKPEPSQGGAEASPPSARTISPLPPNSPLSNRKALQLLTDDTITGGPLSTNKSKKVKLPWKRRTKRKEDGSPEREFNAEPVQKWLDEIQKMQLEDSKNNRHSLERLDVINAYKGQPTATINVAGDAKAAAMSISPLARVTEADGNGVEVKPRSHSDTSVTSARKNSDATEMPVPRPRMTSCAKRQAPRPPEDEDKEEDSDDDDGGDYVEMLQKSYSTSPPARKRQGSCDNGNVYENVGVQRLEDAPPYKPTRRVRNRTTGFEDLPSQKRMAPKVPEEELKSPLCRKQSLSDQDLRNIPVLEEDRRISASEDDGKIDVSEEERKISTPEENHPVPPPRTRRQSDPQSVVVEAATSSPFKSVRKPIVREGSTTSVEQNKTPIKSAMKTKIPEASANVEQNRTPIKSAMNTKVSEERTNVAQNRTPVKSAVKPIVSKESTQIVQNITPIKSAVKPIVPEESTKLQQIRTPVKAAVKPRVLEESTKIKQNGTPNGTPIKSLVKTKLPEESTKLEQNLTPKRPVRILTPRSSYKNSTGSKNSAIYDNLEYLLTSDLKLGEKAELDSFYSNNEPDEESGSCKVDVAVQCSSSTPDYGMTGVMDSMILMTRRTLLTYLSTWKQRPPQKVWWSKDTKWAKLINREEPCWCDQETVFYQAYHKDHADSPVTVMIPLRSERDQVLQVAEFSKSVSSHPNLYTIHASSSLNLGSGNGISAHSKTGTASTRSSFRRKSSDLPAIVVDKKPIMSLSAFVKENQQYHLEHAEKYEEDVGLILLQLCSAIKHLESHHMCLKRINIEHVHLVQKSSSALKVVLNHMVSELYCGQSDDGRLLASDEQIALRKAEFSIGLLAYELLHCPSPFSTTASLRSGTYRAADLPPIPNRSKYSPFLHNIASKFLSRHSSERLTASQGVLALQTMLWGPQMDQLPFHVQNAEDLELALTQWLMVAQAGVVTIVAEAAVAHQVIRCRLKDQMKCQYLSEAKIPSLKEGLTLLYFMT